MGFSFIAVCPTKFVIINTQKPIVFFDGVCGLCNRAVNVLLRHDEDAYFKVAPLQGSTARALLGNLPEKVDSIVLWEEGSVYIKSDAALRIASRLTGWPRLLLSARILPRYFRDKVYDLIARKRYHWFGKKETCRVPTEQERLRFLP